MTMRLQHQGQRLADVGVVIDHMHQACFTHFELPKLYKFILPVAAVKVRYLAQVGS
jgi:hypothetical protein